MKKNKRYITGMITDAILFGILMVYSIVEMILVNNLNELPENYNFWSLTNNTYGFECLHDFKLYANISGTIAIIVWLILCAVILLLNLYLYKHSDADPKLLTKYFNNKLRELINSGNSDEVVSEETSAEIKEIYNIMKSRDIEFDSDLEDIVTKYF